MSAAGVRGLPRVRLGLPMQVWGSVMLIQADVTRLPLPDKSVDLVFGSPPYLDARTYGIGAVRNLEQWTSWMMEVNREAVRVCRGLVLWVVAGVTRDWCYQPGPEALLADWVRSGGIAWRPAYWRRVGIPGSGGKQWLRADVEYVLAFTENRGLLPIACDNTANGHPPKYAPGGEMSYRLTDGSRRDKFGNTGHSSSTSGRKKSGQFKPPRWGVGGDMPETAGGDTRRRRKLVTIPRDGQHQNQQDYVEPVLANPGNLITTKVGGGHMGNKLASENEAPFPESLAKWFIRAWCPPGGIVLDPFSGSGTTVCVARQLNRIGIGCDLRMSQCKLGLKRLRQGQQKELVP